MNRRSFLRTLGLGAVAATIPAGALKLFEDPERALWVPGQKTIIDLGATVQVLPATDEEILRDATRKLLSNPNLNGFDDRRLRRNLRELDRERHVKVEIMGPNGLRPFHYEGDKLVGVYSESDLALLHRPMLSDREARRRAARERIMGGGYDISTDE